MVGEGPAGVRAPVVARKSLNGDGAKGAQEGGWGTEPEIELPSRECHPAKQVGNRWSGRPNRRRFLRKRLMLTILLREGEASASARLLNPVGVSGPTGRGQSILIGQPPTGEPYAGDPPVRFGGRGSCGSPYPYRYFHRSCHTAGACSVM